MPKKLHEIRNLGAGTILNSDEKDTNQEASTYALNVESSSKKGELKGVKVERPVFTIGDEIEISSSVLWNQKDWVWTNYSINDDKFMLEDVSLFNEEPTAIVNTNGVKGIPEQLKLTDIRPILSTYPHKIGTDDEFNVHYPLYKRNDGTLTGTYEGTNVTPEDTVINFAQNDIRAIWPSHLTLGTLYSYLNISPSGNITGGEFNITITMPGGESISDVRDGLDQKGFQLVTPNGARIKYKFNKTTAYNTGQLVSGHVIIETSHCANVTAIALEIQRAFTHPKQWDGGVEDSANSAGHGSSQLGVKSTSGGTTTFEYTYPVITSLLREGGYFSLHDNTLDINSIKSANEILKAESITVSTVMIDGGADPDYAFPVIQVNCIRGCFGTIPSSYNLSNSHRLVKQCVRIRNHIYDTTKGTFKVEKWKKFSGNNLRSSSLFEFGGVDNWFHTPSSGSFNEYQIEKQGKINAASKNITFSSKDKSISFTGAENVAFNSGDKIHIFYESGGTPLNNNKTLTILSKETGSLIVKESLVDETVTTGFFYIEGGLIKNGSLIHNYGVSGNKVSNGWEEVNLKITPDSPDGGNQEKVNNYYENSSSPLCSILSSGGIAEDANSYLGGQGQAHTHYPFESNKKVVSIPSVYKRSGGTTHTNWGATITATATEFSSESINFERSYATNDILKINSEYIRVSGVEKTKIHLERGIYGTTAAEHTGSYVVYRNIRTSLKYTLSREGLKNGQNYDLTFWAKTPTASGANGFVSISYNEGFVDRNGDLETGNLINDGQYYSPTSDTLFAKERKWIDFNDLNKVYNDSHQNNQSNVDDTFRKFQLKLNINQLNELNTDIVIEFCSAGLENSIVYLDYVQFNESSVFYLDNNSEKITNTFFLKDKEVRDLVIYNSHRQRLSAYRNWKAGEKITESEIAVSPFVDNTLTSTGGVINAVNRNKEAHISFGSSANDSSPIWMGYPGQLNFGEDNRDTLYIDEDTVHSYQEPGAYSLDKICAAGEFEFQDAELSGAELTVTCTGSHGLKAGDNIVVREWADYDNSWDGKGVWYISALDGTDPNTKFVCKRHADDFSPTIGPRAGKINFRPYYWYGIRVGSPYLYRITPDTRIKSNGSLDTDEKCLRGKILKSSNLGFSPKSITTYHNKSTDGSCGGRVYLLSDKQSANDVIEFYVADLRVPYDSFENNAVLMTSNVMFTMPHCTYTHANREMKARNGTRVISDGQETSTMGTSKTIPFAGTPSDIIETKGTAYSYNPNAINPTTNKPEDFDTRLWIACKGTFAEGDRFLFCAYTDETADTQANPLYGADRGPSTATTHLPDTPSDISGGTSGFESNYLSLPYGRISNNTNPHLLFGTQDSSHRQLYGGNKWPEMQFMKTNKTSSPTWRHFNWYCGEVWGAQHVLLGDNIGWQSTSDFLGQGPNITIPRFPLMAMSDNDGDGLIDGTGLVVSNTTTLTLTGDDAGLNGDFHGPYGYEGQRVTSHCVGLLGDGNNRKWIVKAGGWGPGANYFDGYDDRYYTAGRLWGREGMLKKIADVLFVCPDIHSGDRVAGRAAMQNGNLLYSNIQGGDMFGTKIWDGEAFVGTQSQVYGNGIDDGVLGGSADNYNCFNCLISDVQSFIAHRGFAYNSTDYTAGTWGTENVSKQATWAIQKNTFLPTSSEYGASTWQAHYTSEAAPGFYSKSWWQAPSSLHNYSSYNRHPDADQGDDDNFESVYETWNDTYDMEAPGIFGKVKAMYDNMPITFRNDRLNFRAGFIMRPIIAGGPSVTTMSNDFGTNTVIQNVSFPDAIHYEGSKDLALTNTYFHAAQAAEADGSDPVSRTVAISNGADAPVSNYTLSQLKEILLGEYVYNANKEIVGKVTAVPDLSSLTFGEGLYRDISDDDAIYVNRAFGASMGNEKYNASRIYIFKNTENDNFNMKTYNANHLLMRRSTLDNTYTGNQDAHMREPYLTGTLNGGSYINTVTGNCTLKAAFPKYGCIALSPTGVTGPADVLTDESSSYNLFVNNHTTMMKGDAGGYTDAAYTDKPYQSTFIGGGFGFTNKIVGNILQIKDVSTGVYYTRYIAGSEWNETDSKLYLMLHYPLPNSYTVNASDTFEIFSHAMSCVSDLALDAENIGADSNKTITGQSNVYAKATYGGLDLRRQTLWRVINSDETSVGANCTIKVWPATHPFKVGDFINFLAADSGSDGLYNITSIGGASGNEITFVSAAGTDSNSNLQNVRMDNVEFTTIDRGGEGTISEYRFEVEPYSQSIGASDDQYDKADVAPNIFASTENKKWVKEASTQSVILTPSASTGQPGDYFQTSSSNTYSYNISFTYDGYQEGPLSISPFVANLSATHSDITITLKIVKFSNRLTSVNLYRKDNDNEFYRLVKAIPTDTGWAPSDDGEGYVISYRDDGSVFGTYESRTGLNETVDNIKVNYAISEEIDGYLFVGDSSHLSISDASNQIFRSKPGRYSIFDWTNDFVILGSTPTAMANFNGRLYVFDSNNIYKINPHTLQIEDTYEGVGCINKDSVVVTEKGMFFADYTGAYWHDGQKPIQISESIYQGDFDTDWNSTSPIYNTSWHNLMSSSNYLYSRCIFDGTLNNVLFIISSEIFNPVTNEKELKNYIWSYNLMQARWDLWELSNGAEVGSPIKGLNGEIYIPINETIFELGKGNLNKPFTFMTKELSLGEDSIVKVYNKIKINGLNESLSSNLTNSENLLIKTSNGTLNQNEITYVDKVADSEYKLSGSNKKGRWIKLLLENVTDSIDSLGIIYRRKTTK